MELGKIKSKKLSKLIEKLSEYEENMKYKAVTEERERIAKELKEQGYVDEDIAKATRLDLTEVELIEVNRVKQLLHYRLKVEDERRAMNE